jgi:hypothetical protein
MSDERTLEEEGMLQKGYGREGRSRDRRVVETRQRMAKETEVQISTHLVDLDELPIQSS